MPTLRQHIVIEARACLGTKWHHRGRVPGVVLDCAGLLVHIARKFGIRPPDFDVPEYSENPDGRLRDFCREHLIVIRKDELQPGDAVAVATSRDPQHLGIVVDYKWGGGLGIVHVTNDARYNCAIESRLWFRPDFRFCEAYAFPWAGVEWWVK